MKTITQDVLPLKPVETVKVYDYDEQHVFSITVEKNEIETITRLIRNGEVNLSMTEKNNGSGVSFDKDLRNIKLDRLLDIKHLLDFNSTYLKSSELYSFQSNLVIDEDGKLITV